MMGPLRFALQLRRIDIASSGTLPLPQQMERGPVCGPIEFPDPGTKVGRKGYSLVSRSRRRRIAGAFIDAASLR